MKAFSPAQTGEVDRVIGTSTRVKDESQDEVIIQCPFETSGHTRLKGEDHKFLVAHYPWQLWKTTLTPRSKFQVMKAAATIGPHTFITGTSLPLGAWPFAEESLPPKQAVG